ncbi:peptidyl-tRNA hydrolase [Paeniglutamicibacter antarcticus]|uniref:peptidyl-tRNA hydrolase n=1 Tax=Paeniglutamicibacter antarcticus TaxID=494023 RepID=A0ABP9TGG8_9MICC
MPHRLDPVENAPNDPSSPVLPGGDFPEPTGELVQPIILLVDREEPCPEDEGIAVAALASVKALLANPRHPYWRIWAQGAFAKSVRRADSKMFAKVTLEFPDHELAEIGTARALGFAPMEAGSLPKRLAKLQVSGTVLPPGEPMEPTSVRIVLDDSLGMSTGKVAAQAAHALFAWVLEGKPEELDAWRAAGCPLSIERIDSTAFRKNARTADGPVIRDAGRTEITPGSATAFVSVSPRTQRRP